jgi:hypothetical protein
MFELLGAALLGLLGCIGGRLFTRLFWSATGVMAENRVDDPVYKQNLQRLIERNRESEEARKLRNEPHS